MSTQKMKIKDFMVEARAAVNRKDGYIMGTKGQDPKKLNAWFFNQYNPNSSSAGSSASKSTYAKALQWKENAERVWDCNGLSEGIYQDFSGVNINTKARYNYSQWCDPKGTGMIPVEKRVEGAAVFWGKKASNITHVAYLDEPVEKDKPEGDWWIIEARGVMYGVVRTKLYSRKPNFWGWMTKYFDYENVSVETKNTLLGDRVLRNDDEGEDVKQLQTNLIRLGYDCGSYGANGDFDDATELALMEFQKDHGLEDDGIYGEKSHEAMEKALAELEKPVEQPKKVKIEGGQCWIRSEPDTSNNKNKMGVAKKNTVWVFAGQVADNGWLSIDYNGKVGWVSDLYGRLTNG